MSYIIDALYIAREVSLIVFAVVTSPFGIVAALLML